MTKHKQKTIIPQLRNYLCDNDDNLKKRQGQRTKLTQTVFENTTSSIKINN